VLPANALVLANERVDGLRVRRQTQLPEQVGHGEKILVHSMPFASK
jgi:hypothetical protein